MKTLILIAIAEHEVERISSPAVLPGGIQLLSVGISTERNLVSLMG